MRLPARAASVAGLMYGESAAAENYACNLGRLAGGPRTMACNLLGGELGLRFVLKLLTVGVNAERARSGAGPAWRAEPRGVRCRRLCWIGVVQVKTLLVLIGWLVLLVLCWPLALLALVLWPVVWLLSLPFRLVGIAVGAVVALLQAVLFLPARLLGYRRAASA